jgi:hypothetical protein
LQTSKTKFVYKLKYNQIQGRNILPNFRNKIIEIYIQSKIMLVIDWESAWEWTGLNSHVYTASQFCTPPKNGKNKTKQKPKQKTKYKKPKKTKRKKEKIKRYEL